MSLSLQPPELLDVIASFIPLPRDLLSLALATKTLNTIVIPQHLEFRAVRCDARRASLWKALTKHPGLARRILSLDLRQERIPLNANTRPLVPVSLISVAAPLADCYSTDVRAKKCKHECADALCAAISVMHGLTRFSFAQSTFAQLHPIEPIFKTVLTHCPSLVELELDFYDGMPSLDSVSGPLWELANLTRVSLTVHRHPMVKTAPRKYLANLFQMLTRCPDLQHLRIASEMRNALADFSAFLADASWPHLRRLVIEGDVTFSSISLATAFLARHPQIEVLSLPERIELPPLPRLRWLFIPGFALVDPAARFPRLEYAAMTDAFWAAQTDADVATVVTTLRTLPALRGAMLSLPTPGALQTLARGVPYLERLSLGCAPWNPDRTHARGASVLSVECIAILASFAHLTHLDSAAVIVYVPAPAPADALHGPAVNADTDDATTALDTLLHALTAAPKLKYAAVDVRHPGVFWPVLTWFRIFRDAEGVYAGHKKVRNWDLEGLRVHDWEDVFRNVGIY